MPVSICFSWQLFLPFSPNLPSDWKKNTAANTHWDSKRAWNGPRVWSAFSKGEQGSGKLLTNSSEKWSLLGKYILSFLLSLTFLRVGRGKNRGKPRHLAVWKLQWISERERIGERRGAEGSLLGKLAAVPVLSVNKRYWVLGFFSGISQLSLEEQWHYMPSNFILINYWSLNSISNRSVFNVLHTSTSPPKGVRALEIEVPFGSINFFHPSRHLGIFNFVVSTSLPKIRLDYEPTIELLENRLRFVASLIFTQTGALYPFTQTP